MNNDNKLGATTRDALVRHGRELFADRGFEGASIRAITGSAGANLGAVTYHFGSKDALYAEVLRSVVAPLRERIQAALAGGGSPLDRVEGVMRAFFGHHRDNPDMARLMLQRIAAGQPPPPPVASIVREILRSLAGLIAEGQASGEIREGHPVRMALSVVAQPVYLSLVRPILGKVTGDASLADLEALMDHAAEFARAGLSADGGIS
ncbi:MAG: TetR/AcrR family transcriptional regulator [Gemmatimonadota bacterium]